MDTKTCNFCKKEFQPTKRTHVHCSTECSVSMQAKKNRERYWKNDKIRNDLKARRLKLRFEILNKFNFACQYCGRKAPEAILEVDHIYPESKGGLNDIKNYTVACKECNLGKGDFILKEFAQ